MTDTQVREWAQLKYDELKQAIVSVIMGQGMGGSTQYLHFITEYFAIIEEQKIKDDVLQIVSELAEDFENVVSSRAIYLLGELPIPDKQQRIIKITQKLVPVIDSLFDAKQIPEFYLKYLDYLCEVNKLIGKLRIVEARQFLEKQAKFIERPMPTPLTTEYYVYHLSARSAIETLKKMQDKNEER